MNPYLLENLMNSATFFLLLFVGILILAIIALIGQVNRSQYLYNEDRANLQMLEDIFINASVPALVIDEKGVIELANKAAGQLYGEKAEDMHGEILDAYSIVTGSGNNRQSMKDALKENKRYYFKANITKEHEKVPCKFSVSPIPSEKVLYLIGISQEKENARNLHERNLLEARINEVEKIGGLGFWLYDYNTRKTTWSRGVYELLGKNPNTTIPDLSFISQFSPQSQKNGQEILMAMKNRTPYQSRISLIDDNGKERLIDMTLGHQEGLGINKMKSYGIMREVTQDKGLIDQNQFNQKLWDTLTNREDVAVVVTNKNGYVHYANDYAAAVVGKSPDSITEYKAQELFGNQKLAPSEIISKSPLTYTSASSLFGARDNFFLWSTLPYPLDDSEAAEIHIGINLTKCVENMEIIQSQFQS